MQIFGLYIAAVGFYLGEVLSARDKLVYDCFYVVIYFLSSAAGVVRKRVFYFWFLGDSGRNQGLDRETSCEFFFCFWSNLNVNKKKFHGLIEPEKGPPNTFHMFWATEPKTNPRTIGRQGSGYATQIRKTV